MEDPDYMEWLAAAPKGVRWDRAQEMYAVYQERRRAQAEAVTKRLLGKRKCISCNGTGHAHIHKCFICRGTGEVINDVKRDGLG